jgi:alcohol dehydrogenase class IV
MDHTRGFREDRMDRFAFHVPTHVFFGTGVIHELGDRIRDLGRKAFVVSGAMGKNSGALGKVVELLEKAGIGCIVFDEVERQPGLETVERGAAAARKEKCDVTIGVGGECPMDAAKVMGLLARNPSLKSDLFGRFGMESRGLPVVTVPLTAGSGSEVTPFAAVTVMDPVHEIRPVVSPCLFPVMAFIDPTFTASFPSAVTLNNGIDALCHCLEAYVSRIRHPLADILALEGVRIVRDVLPEVLADPKNLEWRREMSYAALLGGIVSAQTGIGLVHRMGWYLTLDLGLAHGAANGTVLHAVLQYALRRQGERNGALAHSMGAMPKGMKNGEAAEEILRSVKDFFDRTGFHIPIDKSRVSGETINRFAEGTLRSQQWTWSGWDQMGLEEIKAVFRKAVVPEGEGSS